MAEEIRLPAPSHSGVSVEEAIRGRKSVRSYSSGKITQGELSMLLWAGQGSTGRRGARASPSAGATYPIELYAVLNNVEKAGCGIYHYVPEGHRLVLVRGGEFGEEVAAAALGQESVRGAAAVIVMAAVRERTAGKYGDSADKYIAMEAGHVSQNILLEAVSLGLGAVPIGALNSEEMDRVLEVGEGESALYLVAVGKK